MSFTQKLWTTYHGYSDGDTRIGEKNRIWYSSASNTLRVQLDNTPGGTIIGRGAGGFIDYGDLSVTTSAASGGGTLSYNDANGVFTFRPADLSTFATTSYVNGLKDRIVSPNDTYATYIDNTGTTYSAGDIIPGTAISNLGSVSQPWKDVYVSKGSIVIADNDINVDGVSISNTAKYIVIDRGGLKVTSSIPGREIFQLDNTGKLLLKSEIPAANDSAAFEVIGSLLGESLPIVNRGVMIHSSGAVDIPSRIYIDGVGTQLTAPYDSAYAAFIGRYVRNTVADPQPAQAGDIIVRFGGNAMADGIGLNTISNVRIDMTATETQSAEGRGSRIEFWTTDIGSVTPTRSAHIDSQGIDFSEAADVNAGITFKNSSSLKYWPPVGGNAGKILRTDGTNFYWDAETVPTGQVLFKGNWDASANSPALSTSLPAGVSTGWQYIVSVAGTQNINGTGAVTYGVGDQVIYNGTAWQRIPAQAAQVQADWTETNSALAAYIKHKPTLATVATTGVYGDLSGTPTIPAAQVNTDWTAVSGIAKILNRPADTAADTANTLVLRDSVGGIVAKDFTATQDVSVSTDHGAFNYGTLGYTDTGIMADFSYNANSYNQVVLQNRNAGNAASTNYIVSNNLGTASTYYGEFGMNSSTFAGSGSLALPSAVYLNSISSDLVLGGSALHFVIAGGAADALTINSSGIASFANTISGNSATANQVNHTVTFAATGGAAAGAAFDGSAAKIIDYHTVGAQVAGTYVTSVSGAGVISVTSGTTPQVSISQATASTSGYLSSTDWTTFNNKSNTTGTVTSVGGTGTVSGLTLTGTVTTAGNLTLGGTLSLTSGNVTTALGFTPYSNTNPNGYTTNVGTVTSVTASTTPVNGLSLSGGAITTSGTIAITGTLSGITNTNLSGTAGITNANLATPTISGVQLGNNLATLTISGPLTGTSYNGSSAVSIGIPQATSSVSGYLTSTDWTTFNNKTSNTGTVTSVATAGTVSGLTLTGGTITTSGTITLGGSISGLTNSNLSGTAGITNANLANSTISGVSLGGSLYNLTAGTGIAFSSGTTYNGGTAITINNSITQYTDALARASLSAGTGISYNSGTGVITSTITQYTDALARASLSAGTGISYNSGTGVITNTITQYTDALARAAISVSGSLSYNSGTGVISYTTPTYTVSTASASGGGALSLSGTTFTFTPASIPSFGVGGNQLVFALNANYSLTSLKNTLQSVFGLTNGVTLVSNTRYQYELVLNMQFSKAGALTYALALGSGVAIAQHNYTAQANQTATLTGYTAGITMMSQNATGATITTGTAIGDTNNGYGHYIVRGTIDVTTGGSVNFMVSQDQTVPITWSVLTGSYIKLLPLGAIGSNTADGTWA